MMWLQESAVEIRNVLYQNIKGTSASEVAMQFNCSESIPCQGIVLENIAMQLEGGGEAKASCNNAKLSYRGDVNPRCSEGKALTAVYWKDLCICICVYI